MKYSLLICAFFVIFGVANVEAHAVFENKQALAGALLKGELGIMHGCDGSPTIAVDLTLPDGVIGAKPYAKPGWTITTKRGPYAKAYASMHGVLKDGVREIIWSGGNLPDDFVDDFDFRAEVAQDVSPGPLYFPVVQTCAQGTHRWTQIPNGISSTAALKEPAPAMLILAAADNHAAKAGAIEIENAFTRPTLGGVTVAVGYATIVNNGKTADRLVSVSSDISSTAEVHESKMVNGVMEMHEVRGGLPVAAGASVALRPGSYHIMFLGIKHPVKPGDTIHATFVFSKAGKVEVAFPAASSPGATAPDMGDMKGMKMP